MPPDSSATALLERFSHRHPLRPAQLEAIATALHALRQQHGPNAAALSPHYAVLLRLLKAHATPLPGTDVTFAQIQGARLQVHAENLLASQQPFPPQLSAAIRQGLVAGFDPATGARLPPHHLQAQNAQQHLQQQLQQQIQQQKQQILEEAAKQPWETRVFPVQRPDPLQERPRPLDHNMLVHERERALAVRMQLARARIVKALEDHESAQVPLASREAALLESRRRQIDLLGLQRQMRDKIWNEHIDNEAEDKRGSRGRGRVLKQLKRQFEKVERARIRQLETEERDTRRKRQAWMNALNEHLNKFRSFHRDVVGRGVRAVKRAVVKYHEEVARNSNRAEREAEKARIQKLKDDDEEGYLELVRQTKNTRLLELLEQTDKHLRELGAVVKEERVKSGVVAYDNEPLDKDGKPVKRTYYEIAHAIREEVTEQSSLMVGGRLKEYQLQGIQWMVSLYNNRLNGILADEMGLGKTIQTLGLIAHLMENKNNPGPYLIIVPLSTISNWEMEFAKWAPAVTVIVFKGDKKARRILYDSIIAKNNFNVCLVTYEYVVRGKNLLKRVQWQHLIIDEGHRIKNHESRLSLVLQTYYTSRNRLLLTGTPLQNSLTELWALLNFLLPNVFKSAESFESWFAAPFAQMGVPNVAATERQAQLTEEESLLIIRRLHQVLRPFLLRRLKSDVLRMGEQLPEKQEHVLLCEMSAWQRSIYLKIVKSEKLLFTDRHGRRRYDKLSNPAVQLRKCVNHPYLFYPDHSRLIIDSSDLWRAAGKFDMLDACLMKLLRTGHRVLIFNQMTKVVDLQERLLRYRNIPFFRLDGTTRPEDRKVMVSEFNSEGSDVHVFLLTTRAGGLGVNLQTADTVIIFDSDWNPSMDKQAQDRAHRIGQQREVLVLRMITAKSIEEDVLERASFKRGLEQKIIGAGKFDEQSKDSERQEMLRELLRVQDPGSDGEEDGLQTEEEVNRLLARSEEEFEIFNKVDAERAQEIGNRPKLLVEKEIPEWSTNIPPELLAKSKQSGAGAWGSGLDSFGEEDYDSLMANGARKRRVATHNISYGLDQLSERQYVKLMEKSARGEVATLSDGVRAVQGPKRHKKRRKGDASFRDGSSRARPGIDIERQAPSIAEEDPREAFESQDDEQRLSRVSDLESVPRKRKLLKSKDREDDEESSTLLPDHSIRDLDENSKIEENDSQLKDLPAEDMTLTDDEDDADDDAPNQDDMVLDDEDDDDDDDDDDDGGALDGDDDIENEETNVSKQSIPVNVTRLAQEPSGDGDREGPLGKGAVEAGLSSESAPSVMSKQPLRRMQKKRVRRITSDDDDIDDGEDNQAASTADESDDDGQLDHEEFEAEAAVESPRPIGEDTDDVNVVTESEAIDNDGPYSDGNIDDVGDDDGDMAISEQVSPKRTPSYDPYKPVIDDNSCDEAEDGEIREDGELSEHGHGGNSGEPSANMNFDDLDDGELRADDVKENLIAHGAKLEHFVSSSGKGITPTDASSSIHAALNGDIRGGASSSHENSLPNIVGLSGSVAGSDDGEEGEIMEGP